MPPVLTLLFIGKKRLNACRRHFLSAIFCALGFAVLLPLWIQAADVLPAFTESYLAAATKKYGAAARARMEAWARLIAENRGKTETQKLEMVNSFWNRVPYRTDMQHWRKQDYWATPAEMLASNGGDCEDYAIAKYFTLVALGIDSNKLKITYVKALTEAHMVLTYYEKPTAVPLVLDNMVPQIRPADKRPDLKPIYAFNGDGLWLVRSQQLSSAGNSGNIRFWRDLKSRMGKEFR
jgi:predicted transglutaminase-like cysteine proteinase